jgi:hypothetical protein
MQRPCLIASLTSDVYHLLLADVNYDGEQRRDNEARWTKPARVNL